jgi:hypothetical protein
VALRDYYLWRKDSTRTFPWQRELNRDFLKHESKRIKDTYEWYRNFRDPANKDFGEISLYVVPVKLSAWLKTAIANQGNFNYIGLSALCNSPQTTAIGLVPPSVDPPQEYRLVQITKATRTYIQESRTSAIFKPALIIEDWSYLPSDHIYLDIPYEKGIISKIFRETLIDDEQISLSFQSPMLSAPYNGSLGGISLSSIAGSSPFAKELVKTLQIMVPPEYRTMPPPVSVYRGYDFQYSSGTTFHYAEKPYFGRNVFSSFSSKMLSRLRNELSERSKFPGEFSIFSTTISGGAEVWKELLNSFTDSEVTLPRDLDDLPKEDVYLKPLKRAISEDLWIQIANARQYNPGIDPTIDDEFTKIKIQLSKDLETILSPIHRSEEDGRYMARSMLDRTIQNCVRVAQSLARSDEKERLSIELLKKARNLTVDNLTGFVEHPAIRRSREKMEDTRANDRFLVVQTEIISNPRSSAVEIFQAVRETGLFRNLFDLQRLLDWMQVKGYVIVNREGRYIWV